MTPSELADKLEKHESNGHMETFHALMFLYRDSILKSLRFAADMERLYAQGRCPLFFGSGGGDPMVQLSLYDFGERVHFYAEDIYSAARKAVKELEGTGRCCQ